MQPTASETPASRNRRPRRSFASRLLPVLAILFVGGIAVATSLPAAAFGPAVSFPGVGQSAGALPPGQSLAVAGSALSAVRDGYSVSTPTPTPTPTPVITYQAAGSSGGVGGGWGCTAYPDADTTRITWPYDHPVPQSDGYGPRAEGFHQGVDLLGGYGTPVQAIADGIVDSVSYNGAAGNYVAIAHLVGGQRLCSMYMHFQDGSIDVAVGQTVTAGTVLALTGQTGDATAPHCHFQIATQDGTTFDPMPWLTANAQYLTPPG